MLTKHISLKLGKVLASSEWWSLILMHLFWGAQKLTGENLKLAWAEFSTLSKSVLMMSVYFFTRMHAHVENLAQV
jgi:hypothetical protein